MLHDLFLLSEYFDPPSALAEGRDLVKRYGAKALVRAMESGYLRSYTMPCAGGGCKTYYTLSDEGSAMVQHAYLATE